MSLAYGVFPSQLLDTIPLDDLLFMYRLYLVQPFGYRREEFNAGLIASTIANASRKSSSDPTYKTLDFMPYSTYRVVDVDEENLRILQMYRSRSNG